VNYKERQKASKTAARMVRLYTTDRNKVGIPFKFHGSEQVYVVDERGTMLRYEKWAAKQAAKKGLRR
jgi:hypothetical protein